MIVSSMSCNDVVVNRTKIVPSNPLKSDPTRTKTLRRAFEQEFRRRFQKLKGLILQLIVVEDAFGLKQKVKPTVARLTGNIKELSDVQSTGSQGETWGSEETETANRETDRVVRASDKAFRRESRVTDSSIPTENQRFAFRNSAEQVRLFNEWLKTQVDTEILTVTEAQASDAYWRRFSQEGYEKGAGRAFNDVRKPALSSDAAGVSDFFEGSRREFLRQSFANPVAIGKIQLLAGRVFTDLKGVTEVMGATMSRELAQGLAQGDHPDIIARRMVGPGSPLEKIGKRRAALIARTEVIRAHAEGQLDSFERLGVDKIGVMAEWSTAGDERVCQLCQPLEGVVMTVKEARGLIPRHPDCKCSYVAANVGEDKNKKTRVNFTNPQTGKVEVKHIGQTRGKEGVEGAIDKSLSRQIPKGRKIKGKEGIRFKDPETGRFTVKRSKRTIAQEKNVVGRMGDGREIVSQGDLKFTRSKLDSDTTMISVPTKKLDKEWIKNKDSYIASDGTGGIPGRRERFRKFIQEGGGTLAKPLETPRVYLDPVEKLSFGNGRHRVSVLRDRGEKRILVSVPKDQVKKFKQVLDIPSSTISKRTIAQEKNRAVWPGGRKTIAKKRPRSILEGPEPKKITPKLVTPKKSRQVSIPNPVPRMKPKPKAKPKTDLEKARTRVNDLESLGIDPESGPQVRIPLKQDPQLEKTQKAMMQISVEAERGGVKVPFKKRRVQLDKMIATQPDLGKEPLLRYIEEFNKLSPKEAAASLGEKHYLIKINGKFYAVEGHHRTSALKLLDKIKSVNVNIIDYDAARELLVKKGIFLTDSGRKIILKASKPKPS